MTDILAFVTIPVPSVPQHVEGPKPAMESVFTLDWSRRTMAEIRVLCTGLFATGVLARAISILGLDPRPTPTSLTMSDQGVFPFLIFVVRIISPIPRFGLIIQRKSL